MNYFDALKMYELPKVHTVEDINSRYRELIKLNHPDNTSVSILSIDDIRLAKSVLCTGIINTSSSKDRRIIEVEYFDLLTLYDTGELDGVRLRDLRDNLSFIRFNYSIKHRDGRAMFTSVLPYGDLSYTTDCYLSLQDFYGTAIELDFCGEVRNVILDGETFRFRLKLKKNINVVLNLFVVNRVDLDE